MRCFCKREVRKSSFSLDEESQTRNGAGFPGQVQQNCSRLISGVTQSTKIFLQEALGPGHWNQSVRNCLVPGGYG